MLRLVLCEFPNDLGYPTHNGDLPQAFVLSFVTPMLGEKLAVLA
jgi:hypothetical protein